MKKYNDLQNIAIPIIGDLKGNDIPSPEEYTYWKAREKRVFYIDYEIDEDYMLIELSKIIIQMNIDEKDVENPDPIYLYIHSYGGDLDQAYSFCDICISSRIPIVTINMGVAMSAGLLILLSGKRRYTFKHSSALVHQGFAGFQGTAEQIDEAQKAYKKQLAQMKDYILERTNIDEKTFNKHRTKDWYLTSTEQLDLGVVNKIISSFDEIL